MLRRTTLGAILTLLALCLPVDRQQAGAQGWPAVNLNVPAGRTAIGAPGFVKTNAALKLAKGTDFPDGVTRQGFTAAGDGGAATYYWNAVNCVTPDDGAQVTATGGGCWIADFGDTIPTPLVWGAVGDGATDDRAKVQAAIDARKTQSLDVGTRRYCIGSPGLVAYNPIRLYSATRGYSEEVKAAQYGLVACAVNLNLLTLSNNGTTSASGSIIDGVFFDTRSAGNSTQGAALVNYSTFNVLMNGLRMDIGCIGLDELLSVLNKFNNGSIRNSGTALPAGCGGIRVGHLSTSGALTDFQINDSHVDAIGPWSVKVEDAGGMFITGSDFLAADYGVLIQPGVNQAVMWFTASHAYLADSGCLVGLFIDTADSTAAVTGASFVQNWTSSFGAPYFRTGCDTGSGVQVRNSASGTVRGVHFVGHRAHNNDRSGFIIDAGVSDVTIDDSEVCNNSVVTATIPGLSYDGIEIGDGASKIAIRNNRISANCINMPLSAQAAGIKFLGASSDMTIVGNDLRDNVISGIGGAAPTGNTVIKDNNGVDSSILSVAGAPTVAIGFEPTVIILGGGASIGTITGMWGGREVRLFMRDGSNSFVTGGNLCPGNLPITLPQYTSVTAFYIPGANCISVK